METSLTKREVARRQLITAIRLFFDGGDPVSIFSLSANAWEVIDVLCNKTSTESLSNETREHVPKGKDLKYDYINSPYRNFFKHADRDPDGTLTCFEETDVDSVIFLSVEDYLRIFKKSPVEFQVFQLWYLAVNEEKVSTKYLDEILKPITSTFPKIRGLSRKEQIRMGGRVLDVALKDKELINDVNTEATF